jgi:spore germination cell wall hydrolase CwlJ-like protein
MSLIPIHDKNIGEKPSKENLQEHAFELALSIDVLARTIWGEARGEGTIGMQAVASVVLNRFEAATKKGAHWWGSSFIEICQKPYQFSCWNENDPNLHKLLHVDTSDLYFATAKRIAQRCILGCLDDPTSGATHYHAAGIMPRWAKGEEQTTTIGSHIFYRIED